MMLTGAVIVCIAAFAAGASIGCVWKIQRILRADKAWMLQKHQEIMDFECWLDEFRRRRQGDSDGAS